MTHPGHQVVTDPHHAAVHAVMQAQIDAGGGGGSASAVDVHAYSSTHLTAFDPSGGGVCPAASGDIYDTAGASPPTFNSGGGLVIPATGLYAITMGIFSPIAVTAAVTANLSITTSRTTGAGLSATVPNGEEYGPTVGAVMWLEETEVVAASLTGDSQTIADLYVSFDVVSILSSS